MHTNFCSEDAKYRVMGWREWLALPDLKIDLIKAKIDTGARTSALHAFQVNVFEREDLKMVDFSIHPDQHTKEKVIQCVAMLHDMRLVTDSGGHKQLRPVIKTQVSLDSYSWEIEVTLTNRDSMNFRFLLGRTAIPTGFLVDPLASYLFGKKAVQSTLSQSAT